MVMITHKKVSSSGKWGLLVGKKTYKRKIPCNRCQKKFFPKSHNIRICDDCKEKQIRRC